MRLPRRIAPRHDGAEKYSNLPHPLFERGKTYFHLHPVFEKECDSIFYKPGYKFSLKTILF